MRKGHWAGAAVLLFALLSGCGLSLLQPQSRSENLTGLVKKIQKSVVTVVTFDTDESVLSLGSGFFVDARGHLITNYHVLKGAYSAVVKTHDGQKYPIEWVVAENKTADLIKVRVDLPEQLIPGVRVTDMEPSIGERILVVGSPLGLDQTVSDGIVSAVREIPAVGKIFQMSAPISPGSSGSPVINMQGQVVGVVSFQSLRGQNLNFAVAGSKVLALMQEEPVKTLSEWTYGISRQIPKIAEALCKKGFNFYIKGEYKEALKFYQEATEKSPDDAEAWSGLGHCYVGLAQPSEAIAAYKEVIRTNPDDASAYYNLAGYYKELGRYEEALESYQQTVRIDPDHAPAYFDMGMAYAELNRLEDGKKAFKQVVRINPRHAPSYYNIGFACGKLGQYDDAIEAYQNALQINPEHVPALYNLGLAYGALGRSTDELEAYKQAIRVDPDYAPAHYNVGVIHINAGERDAALQEYKILKRLDEDIANTLFNLIYP